MLGWERKGERGGLLEEVMETALDGLKSLVVLCGCIDYIVTPPPAAPTILRLECPFLLSSTCVYASQ